MDLQLDRVVGPVRVATSSRYRPVSVDPHCRALALPLHFRMRSGLQVHPSVDHEAMLRRQDRMCHRLNLIRMAVAHQSHRSVRLLDAEVLAISEYVEGYH